MFCSTEKLSHVMSIMADQGPLFFDPLDIANLSQLNKELAASKPFVPLLQPRLNALDGSVRDS